MIAQAWRFLAREKPVLVDWLPWSHTVGGNHNLHMVMCHGGTLVIDEGRPAPGLPFPSGSHRRGIGSSGWSHRRAGSSSEYTVVI